MLEKIKSVIFKSENKVNSSLEEIENFLLYLDEVMGIQEKGFQQIQLHLMEKAVKVYNAETYNQHIMAKQALIIFKEAILQQIEVHEHPHYFQGLKLAIHDYFTQEHVQ